MHHLRQFDSLIKYSFIFCFFLKLFACFVGMLLKTVLHLLHAKQMLISAPSKTQTSGDQLMRLRWPKEKELRGKLKKQKKLCFLSPSILWSLERLLEFYFFSRI